MLQHGIHKRYWACRFDVLDTCGIPGDMVPHYVEAKEYADNFERYYRKGIGMLLKGPVGTMKTTLAVAVLQEVIRKTGGGYFVAMAGLMDKLMMMWRGYRIEEMQRFERRIRNTPLLVIDDLGAEYEHEVTIAKIDAIISERYDRQLPIIITTNLANNGIMGRYQARVYDRLKGTSLVITCKGESQRKEPKKQEDKYGK